MNKICGIYKITNTITGDFYIGSSKNIKQRWAVHKCRSSWNEQPNNPLYLDFQKYGIDKFSFEILAEAEAEKLKEKEQQFIETFKPTYNNRNANGLNAEKKKEYNKEYRKTDKYKEYKKEYNKSDKIKEYQKEYQKSEKFKKYQKEYYKSDKGKESLKKAQNKYQNQLCSYNGEVLTLGTLSKRFARAGIPHPTIEAKKYLI